MTSVPPLMIVMKKKSCNMKRRASDLHPGVMNEKGSSTSAQKKWVYTLECS